MSAICTSSFHQETSETKIQVWQCNMVTWCKQIPKCIQMPHSSCFVFCHPPTSKAKKRLFGLLELARQNWKAPLQAVCSSSAAKFSTTQVGQTFGHLNIQRAFKLDYLGVVITSENYPMLIFPGLKCKVEATQQDLRKTTWPITGVREKVSKFNIFCRRKSKMIWNILTFFWCQKLLLPQLHM